MGLHGVYDGLLRDLVLRLKFSLDLGVLDLLSGLVVESYDRTFAGAGAAQHDIIAPVPLHSTRLRWRGFNQSVELSRRLARTRSMELCPGALARVRATRPQVELPLAERLTNLKGAFAVARDGGVEGARVLLVDDVATSCATLQESARELNRAGAASVDALVLARAADI